MEVSCNFLDQMLLDKLLLGNLKQQPQTFQYLLPPIPYNIYFCYHWWYKSSNSYGYCVSDRRQSLLLRGVYCIMVTTTVLIWNYRRDRNSWGFPWDIFRTIPAKHVLLPGAPQLPVPFLFSVSGLGKTSFTLLGFSAASRSRLFSSPQLPMTQRAQSKTILASRLSKATWYCRGVLSSIQRTGAVGPRLDEKTHMGTDTRLYHGLLKPSANCGLVFPRNNFLSGRRKTNPFSPLSGLRAVSVYALRSICVLK